VGARSAEQAKGVMRVANLDLTPDEIEEIEAPTAAALSL
jgi:aryl-alcohol dehydrogenase-like predicted oxidoreductase